MKHNTHVSVSMEIQINYAPIIFSIQLSYFQFLYQNARKKKNDTKTHLFGKIIVFQQCPVARKYTVNLKMNVIMRTTRS